MNDWLPILGTILGTGGVIGIVAHFVRPASERIAYKRKAENRTTFLSSGVIALSGAYDNLRWIVLRHETDRTIPNSTEVLDTVRENLDKLNED